MGHLESTTENFPDDLVELASPFDFATTLEKSTQTAREAGLQLPPTVS